MKRESRFTLLDAYYTHQLSLARLFHRPGTCYGDLRRTRLMAEQATNVSVHVSARMMLRTVRSADTSEVDYELQALQEDYDKMYLARLDEEEGERPHFFGGTLEKKAGVDCIYDKYVRNTNAKNATRHRFARPSASRVSVRHLRPRGPRKSLLVKLLNELG